jgi:phosphoserine phosphatase RsbU/P
MEIAALGSARDQLLDRRARLEEAAAIAGQADEVTRLLSEIDAALIRMNAGTFGICETCHDPIEPERLATDPLTRVCIDHLTPTEQRALEHDLELASRIQRELLPKPDHHVDGWETAYHYRPAGTVSGDYCDVIPGNDGDVYFLVGDVAGHGVAAAMLMSHLSALLRTLISLGLPLSEMMDRANHAFCESTPAAHYATLVCARALASGEIEISNAGHPPPLLVHNDVVMRIDATSVPIGLFCSGRFSSCRVQLAPGDALLLYTDGLPETESPAGEAYGIDRIADLAVSASRTPSALVDACVRDVATFRGAAVATDDLTIFAVSRRPVFEG